MKRIGGEAPDTLVGEGHLDRPFPIRLLCSGTGHATIGGCEQDRRAHRTAPWGGRIIPSSTARSSLLFSLPAEASRRHGTSVPRCVTTVLGPHIPHEPLLVSRIVGHAVSQVSRTSRADGRELQGSHQQGGITARRIT